MLVFVPTDQTWRARDPRLSLHFDTWDNAGDLTVEIEEREIVVREARAIEPDVFLLPTGDATPFAVRLSKTGTGAASCEVD
ncbi:MAG: hypothetical protein AAFN94_04035, partial [Pseudomonadota bacterium]